MASTARLDLCLVLRLGIIVQVLFCSFSWAQDLALPGPYPASTRTLTVTRSGGGTFSALVYYPASSTTSGAPFHPTCPPAPILTFGHGFFQTVTTYQSTLTHLATHGYIVIATTSEGGLFPSHANFASDIRTCITHLETLNTTPGSFVEQRLAPDRVGIFGHSMGGGASILAAAADARIDAVATLAAADTNPSSITAAASVNVPLLLISGTSDTIVPPAQNQSHYASARAAKSYPLIAGGFHCGYQDSSGFGCDSVTTLPRNEQLAIVRRQLTTWFDLYLKQDQSRWRATWGPEIIPDPRLTTTQDSGLSIALVGPAPLSLVVNVPRSITIRITNTAPRAQVVAALGEPSNPAWSCTTASTTLLSTGQSQEVTVQLTAAAPSPAPITTVLSARSADGGTRAWLALQSTAYCAADINQDAVVDFFDYLDFVASFSDTDPTADFNLDGTVDFFDYLDFVDVFSTGGC